MRTVDFGGSPGRARRPGPAAQVEAIRPGWSGGWGRALLGVALCLLLGGCAEAPSALDPEGPRAAEIAGLWWIMLGLGAAVYLAVAALLLFALYRARRGQRADSVGPFGGTAFVVLSGIVVPVLILIPVLGSTVRSLQALAAPASPADLTIEVIGHQFWWEVRYPDQQITTANEIHIPVGRPVELRLTSADVIHSFWVPELAGKLDLIPGRTNSFWLQADEPGVYRGQCAEFCGIQHAKMAFLVEADPADRFAAWLDRQRQPVAEPTEHLTRQGLQVFLGSTCVSCHAIRGTPATAQVGPDLTHLASRRTIAAGTLPNNRGTLGGWILDPQEIKPGSYMPPTQLDPESLQALLAYLASLD